MPNCFHRIYMLETKIGKEVRGVLALGEHQGVRGPIVEKFNYPGTIAGVRESEW
jgi:hypothetical protein